MNVSRKVLSLTALTVLAACHSIDPYAARWHEVSIGDSRAAVERVMGSPTSVHTLELPLIELEQADWKTISGRVYVVSYAMGRVVAKSVND